jgi:hypothetical protein
MTLGVERHNVMISFNNQILETQVLIDRLLVDELLHNAMVVQKFGLEITVPVGFYHPSIGLFFSVHEVLR